MKLERIVLGSVAIGACLLAAGASANTITFATASGATESGGNPVDAQAVFTTGNGSLNIQLTDLLANPTDVAQLISDLSFTLSSGQTLGTLSSSSGTEITIDKHGNPTLGSSVSTGWSLSSITGGLELNVLGTPIGPSHLIIGGPDGSGTYSDANGSIAGNGPHNPFLDGTANFTIDILGLSPNDTVDSATFSFGTTAGDNVDGHKVPNVPDGGATALLLGAALTGLGLARRKLNCA